MSWSSATTARWLVALWVVALVVGLFLALGTRHLWPLGVILVGLGVLPIVLWARPAFWALIAGVGLWGGAVFAGIKLLAHRWELLGGAILFVAIAPVLVALVILVVGVYGPDKQREARLRYREAQAREAARREFARGVISDALKSVPKE
jgi:uncharacterized membrane protein